MSIAPSNGRRVFNIGSGRGHSLNEVLATIEEVTRRQVIKRYLDARVFDVPVNVLGIEAAQEFLGWSPKVSFTTGIDSFCKWLESSGDFKNII